MRFLTCFISVTLCIYWSKFHVNIATGLEVMAIFFYKRLTRNKEIGNTHVWVLSNIWRLGQVRYAKFGANVFNKILMRALKSQGCNFHRFWVIKRTPTEKGIILHTDKGWINSCCKGKYIRNNVKIILKDSFKILCWYFQVKASVKSLSSSRLFGIMSNFVK